MNEINPIDTTKRVLSLFRMQADRLAEQASEAKAAAGRLDAEIRAEAQDYQAEQQQLATVEQDVARLRKSLERRAELMDELGGRHRATQRDADHLDAQARAAIELIQREYGRLQGVPVALAGPGETGPMPATQDGGPQE